MSIEKRRVDLDRITRGNGGNIVPITRRGLDPQNRPEKALDRRFRRLRRRALAARHGPVGSEQALRRQGRSDGP